MLVYCTKKIYSKIVSAPLKVSNIMIKTWLAYLKKQFSSGYLYNVPLFPNFISKWSKSEEFLFLMRDLPVFHFFKIIPVFFNHLFENCLEKALLYLMTMMITMKIIIAITWPIFNLKFSRFIIFGR